MSFPAGTTIVEEGLLGETMFVVTSGEAKVLRGKRRLGTVRPGDFFGEVALLDGAPRSASVVAETPVVAIRLFRRTLLKMLEAEPQLSLKILDSLVRRVRGPARRPRSTPSRSAVLRSRRASPRPVRCRPPRRCRGCASAFLLPAIADVTPGWATFHARASCAIVMSRRSAIGRSPSTIGEVVVELLVGERAVVVGPPPVRRRRRLLPRDRAGQQAEPERTVRHHAGSVLAAPADQVAVVERQHRELLLERIHVADRLASLDQRPVEVRDADGAHRAGVLELGHGAPGVLDRHARLVGPVQLVQVDHVDAEASERTPRIPRGPAPAGTRSPRMPGRASRPRGPGPGARPPRARRSPRRPPCRRPRRCRSSSCPRRARRASRRSRPPPTRSCPTCRRRPPTPRSRSRSSPVRSIRAVSSSCGAA